MKIKIASDDPQSMSQSGDSILRSLQNSEFSIADLIVRESIQNALDATLDNADATKVSYILKSFDSNQLVDHLDGVESSLRAKFSGQQDFLAISDKNTVGLTGDYRAKNPDGNFQKLVFSIGKNQTAAGAGGSWGMGKTSYFKIGCGLVFYYTRIKTNVGYEERLIGSLIESPKVANRILENSSRGIAWWGRYEDNNQLLLPITNHDEIQLFLDIFGLSCYQDDETGTTIIIPYLKDKFDEQADDFQGVNWISSRKLSIKMAVQRWYSPRLMNQNEKIKSLICYFNDELITLSEPTFEIMQELYTAALTGENNNPNIDVNDVKIPRSAMENNDEIVGRVAFMQPNAEMLGMVAPDNLSSPTAYITSDSDDRDAINRIVAFARKPGMIVKYDINGNWSDGVKTDGHLLAFFVANSTGKLQSRFEEETVEDYLRNGEKADHADWFDDKNNTLVKRIRMYVSQNLQQKINDDELNHNVSVSSRLSRHFGQMLLPSAKYGRSGSKNKPQEKNHKNVDSRNRKVDISVTDSNFIDSQHIQLGFTAYLRGDAKIQVQVETQTQNLGIDQWRKEFGEMPFPVSIESVDWKKDYDFEDTLNNDGTLDVTGANNLEAYGTLTLRLASSMYQTILVVRQLKGDN